MHTDIKTTFIHSHSCGNTCRSSGGERATHPRVFQAARVVAVYLLWGQGSPAEDRVSESLSPFTEGKRCHRHDSGTHHDSPTRWRHKAGFGLFVVPVYRWKKRQIKAKWVLTVRGHFKGASKGGFPNCYDFKNQDRCTVVNTFIWFGDQNT